MKRTVQDVMTPQVVTVAPETPFKEVAELLEAHHISAVPVVKGAELVGIVSEADLLDRAGEAAADVMSTPVITIGPEATVTEAARSMHRLRVKRLPVIDGSGALVGIVSRGDLLKPFLRTDQAIANEIREHVLRETLWIDPDSVDVGVAEGVVTLAGQVESRSLSRISEHLVDSVDGVVAVHNNLSYRLDDSHVTVDRPPGSLHYSAQERARAM